MMQWWQLQNKFLESFKAEEESGLLQSSSAGFSVLFTRFLQIKSLLEDLERQINDDNPLISGTLYDLNDALAQTRILANECQEELHQQKKFLFFIKYTLSNYYFILTMKKRLITITLDLERLIGSYKEQRRDKAEVNRDNCVSFREFLVLSWPENIWGFNEQAKKIEDLLFDGNNGGFRAVGIVGIGGSGKTTLVKRVLRSKRVKERFSPVISICFSDAREVNNPGHETEIKFLKLVLRKLERKQTTMGGVNDLLERLNQLLTGKPYLIVLDDVRHKISFFSDLSGPGRAERLSDGLPKGGGGAIIVTSRTTEVARDMVGQNNLIRVQPLDEESCWSIFMNSVSADFSRKTNIIGKLEKLKIEITSRFHGLPSAATTLALVIPRRIYETEIFGVGQSIDMEMCIPAQYLSLDYYVSEVVFIPSCPVLVFVDMKNKQVGQRVVNEVRNFIRKTQVYTVLQEKSNSEQIDEAQNPEIALKKIYTALETFGCRGDRVASEIQKRMRIIVLGGNAVANWILQVICDLKLPHPPPIALIPLETENDFAAPFGWRTRHLGREPQYVTSIFDQVKKAEEKMKIDSWHVLMRMRDRTEAPCDSIEPLELPPSLHPFGRVSNTNELNTEGSHTFRGGFWNYFSIGRDAQVSYALHNERKLHPEKLKSNQTTNAKFTHLQRWLSASVSHSTSRNLAQFIKVMIMKSHHTDWEEMVIPQSIKSIVCLNLPSFSGGFNWGISDTRKHYNRDFTPSYVDDGIIEIVGYGDAWHGLVCLAQKGHGIRLAQVQQIRFLFHKGAIDHAYMSMDGQPWRQPLPVDDETVMVEISHHSLASIVVTQGCKCRSISGLIKISADDEEDSEENNDEKVSEKNKVNKSAEFSKFGAADTFKPPAKRRTQQGARIRGVKEVSEKNSEKNKVNKSAEFSKFGAADTFKLPANRRIQQGARITGVNTYLPAGSAQKCL